MRRITPHRPHDHPQPIGADEILVAMTRQELTALRGTVRETLNELEDWEFELHMGFTREEIESLRTALWEL